VPCELAQLYLGTAWHCTQYVGIAERHCSTATLKAFRMACVARELAEAIQSSEDGRNPVANHHPVKAIPC
jgi:hypothetical protein